jgi:hypothetical protein
MNARRVVFAALLLMMAGSSRPLVAHHAFTMFDIQKDVTFQGVVVEYMWVNPHVHFIVDVKPGPGVDPASVGRWDVECGSTNVMARQGWTRATLKAGDPINFVGHPMKDGSKGVFLFYRIKPDGTRQYRDIARPENKGAVQQ